MTQTTKMLSRKEGGIGYVSFTNPDRLNAVSLDMWAATHEILEDFRQDDAVRVVVVTGAGGKAFVSGADISEFDKQRSNQEQVDRYNSTSDKAFTSLYAMCCDMRICSDQSKFGIPAAKLGLGYGYVGVKRLVDVIGPSFAKEIFYTARQFDAEEARLMGLVNRVVPKDGLETFVKTYADTISGNAPMTIHAVKYAINEAVKDESARNLKHSADLVEQCFASNDYAEGRKAFMEKRKPVFTGT